MLIVYKKVNGEVVDNQGMNNLFPVGVANIQPILDSVVQVHGGTLSDYDVIRLHDVVDKEIVKKTFTHEYTIQNGEIVFGELKPVPEPEPQPPTLEEQLADRDEQILELKANQILTSEIVEINGFQQQELLELLIDMGVI